MGILDDFKPDMLLHDGSLDKLVDLRRTLMDRMFAQPRHGTKAADLNPAEKMWVLRGAGVPMHCEMDGTMMRWVTSVPCAIYDIEGGRYCVSTLNEESGSIRNRPV